ncbi:MAG: TIR domain-containing protein [Nitrospiraceae bacterium]|nr:TIR domain-containing protein [Nitrospiraceae bacterium]
MALLEEVFKLSGVPTHTFVEPAHYDALKVSIRTPGRCCVIEGPSGIGKTTSVKRILAELDVGKNAIELSGRKPGDRAMIEALPGMGELGFVIIDDFHRLPQDVKSSISDFVKILADEEQAGTKIVLLGINKAGDQLVTFGHDVGLRIDVFKMEANPENKIEELIKKGEDALNIEFSAKESIVTRSIGSFQVAQMLCQALCVKDKVVESEKDRKTLLTSIEVVVDAVILDLRRIFLGPTVSFARGSKLRREGRAPYLHILRWLSEAPEWSIDLKDALRTRPKHRGSVGQVVDKGYLEVLLQDKAASLADFFHFQPETSVLSIEDPRLIFYLKNLNWRVFAQEVGYSTQDFRGDWDFALSFAGEQREIAKALADLIKAREVSIWYDYDDQHLILAENVEDYLAPIYRTEASYVIVLLGKDYPRKIWTKFESDNFKTRFGENAVIPISFSDAPAGFFSVIGEKGGLFLHVDGNVDAQLSEFADILCRRISADRQAAKDLEAKIDAAS